MNKHRTLLSAGTAFLVGLAFCGIATAGISTTGNVEPPDPATWDSGTWAYIGKTGTGTMSITAGSDVTSGYGFLGYDSGVSGTVTITGSGSTWTNAWLYVGLYGSGTLNISDSGAVTVGGTTCVAYSSSSSGTINFSTGTLTTGGLLTAPADLTGTGTIYTNALVSDVALVFDATHGLSQNFIINDSVTVNLDVDGSGPMGAGYAGVGTLSISNNQDVISTYGILGYKSGSSGTATVSGAGSTWNNSDDLVIGNRGIGILNIENGGAVLSGAPGSNLGGTLGYGSGATGTATVTGVGSTWTNVGPVSVGHSGTGILNIENGGVVSSPSGFLGYGSGSIATTTVTGAGSIWNTGPLSVGWTGAGTLNIENGGGMSNSWGYLGHFSGSTGTATVTGDGSTWTNSGDLYVGRYGTGTLNIHNGGAVTVGGDLSINSVSTLDVLLASLADPLLDVAGDATLNGTLSVAVDGGLVLDQGDVFTLIDVGTSITGTFIGLAERDSVGNFGGLELFISYVGGDGNDVTLFTAPGDVDGDSWVGDSDLTIVRDNWGKSLGREFGDLNGNGIVDGPDYAEVLSYWNPPSEPPSDTPEPATLLLLVFGGLLLNRRP